MVCTLKTMIWHQLYVNFSWQYDLRRYICPPSSVLCLRIVVYKLRIFQYSGLNLLPNTKIGAIDRLNCVFLL